MWASPATSADLPAAVAPVMRNAQGLPAGVQIIAAKGEDRTAIAVAGMLEAMGCRCEAPPLRGTRSSPPRRDCDINPRLRLIPRRQPGQRMVTGTPQSGHGHRDHAERHDSP